MKGLTSVKYSGQRPGGNTSISLGGGYGGDGSNQFTGAQSRLKAPTNIPKPKPVTQTPKPTKVASPKMTARAKAAQQTMTPNTRHSSGFTGLKKSSGMQDSLNMAGENSMATGKQKGQTLDINDIPGK